MMRRAKALAHVFDNITIFITDHAHIVGYSDSLAAVKKLVLDEKKYTMEDLMEALKSNWEGKEKMRLDFVKSAPKWGNDIYRQDNIIGN